MNKKGQTLVVFVLFLPVLVIVITMIINKSNMYYDKRNMENIAKEAINYGLSNIEDENIENKIKIFVSKNIDCEKEVKIEDGEIRVTLIKENKTIKKILGYENIKIKYKGKIEDNKKKVEVAYGNNESKNNISYIC
ncbi:unknown [Firmicutes bacterium CAG:884]|nr:unknown [Firmicutes bacterium CAG:884]